MRQVQRLLVEHNGQSDAYKYWNKCYDKQKKLEGKEDAEIDRAEGILARKDLSKKRMEAAVNLLKSKGFEVVEEDKKGANINEEKH